MAEKPGKYAAALASVTKSASHEHPANIVLPEKPPPPRGKRSTPGWIQKAVLLKEASVQEALARLKQRPDKPDFSDLMQALLENWLRTAD